MTGREDLINPDERPDDLQIGGLTVIQNPALYRFSEDAVLLSNFAKVKAGGKVCDLGTGCGVIALLMSAKTRAKEIYGVEIQSVFAGMASRSVRYNGLEERIKILNIPMQEAYKELGFESMDSVVCNPPFDRLNMPAEIKSLSTQEACITIDEVAQSAARLLRFGGRFYVIHRGDRLAEVFRALSAHNLEPKVLRFVRSAPDKPPHRILIEAVKGGKAGLRIEL